MSVTAYPVQRPAKQIRMRASVIVENDGKSFHAYCPAFPGLHVDGSTIDEALQNAKEAASVYVSSLLMHGEPLPLGPDCSVLKDEQIPSVPPGALLSYLELQWTSLSTSGIS